MRLNSITKIVISPFFILSMVNSYPQYYRSSSSSSPSSSPDSSKIVTIAKTIPPNDSRIQNENQDSQYVQDSINDTNTIVRTSASINTATTTTKTTTTTPTTTTTTTLTTTITSSSTNSLATPTTDDSFDDTFNDNNIDHIEDTNDDTIEDNIDNPFEDITNDNIMDDTTSNTIQIINDQTKNNNIVYAPYVDITLYPTFDLAEAKKTLGVDTFIVSFIVTCMIPSCNVNGASFGGTIGVDGTDITGAMDAIDNSISKFKSEGGRVIISFGGAFNDELALHHDSPDTLAKEYRKVIEKYQPIQIDFDMEGTGLADDAFKGRKAEEVHKLRAQALNIVRKELKDKMPAISLCLPVNPDIGFDDKALAVIKAMKNENVPVDTISIMAMDYGANYIPKGFYENTINSLEKSYEQSRAIYPNVKMG
ncbi:glycoside hydrolase family 18 protein, partial [Piromyces sp. E2]